MKRADVADWIMHREKLKGRCLIGIDCNFSYAQTIGRSQFGAGYTYLDLWRAVEQSSGHLPDYFAAGFWEHDVYGRHFWSSGKRPEHFKDHHQRVTEISCREKGFGYPESPFKLIGPKQVGKGGLAGMRFLYDLKLKLGKAVCIWPFEDHIDESKLVVVEIYPRLFLKQTGHGSTKVRSSFSLNEALRFFKTGPADDYSEMTDHITDAVISCAGLRAMVTEAERLGKNIFKPAGMTKAIAAREGWILGV